MRVALQRIGISISEKIIRRIMEEEGLSISRSRRRAYSSYRGEISPEVDNVVARDFHADAPNTKWLTDITEFQIPAGKAYLSPLIDCFDGMVVSWTIGTSPDAELVNAMLDTAIACSSQERTPHCAFRQGKPLPVARMDLKNGRGRPYPVDVEEGVLAGQRGLRGLLRPSQKRDVLQSHVGEHDHDKVHRGG